MSHAARIIFDLSTSTGSEEMWCWRTHELAPWRPQPSRGPRNRTLDMTDFIGGRNRTTIGTADLVGQSPEIATYDKRIKRGGKTCSAKAGARNVTS